MKFNNSKQSQQENFFFQIGINTAPIYKGVIES